MSGGRLPNVVVAGVPKAGTGSLFAYLTQHPDVCGGDEKEVGYFNYYNPLRHSGEPPPVESYRQHFARCRSQRYVTEATPTYSYGGKPVVEAMRKVLGQPKVIISLRDPVERLWSAYTFQRSLGNLTGFASFGDYLSECETRKRHAVDLVPRDHLHGLYIGFYAEYIGDWLDAFGDDLRIVFAEHLAQDPAAAFAGLLSWLGLDAAPISALDLGRRNTTKHPRSERVAKLVYSAKRATDRLGLLPTGVRKPLRRAYERVNAGHVPEQLPLDVRAHLEELYRPSNARTADLLAAHGYTNLPSWLNPKGVETPSAASGDETANQGNSL